MKGMMVQRRAMLQVCPQSLLRFGVVPGVPFASRIVADVAGIVGVEGRVCAG